METGYISILDEVQPNASTWSCPGNSGSFVITTDLGRELKNTDNEMAER